MRSTQILSNFYSISAGKVTDILCVTVNAFSYSNFE